MKYEKTAVVLEVVGFILSLFLVITQNPLFCESGCSTLLMSLPLSSLIVFFMLFVIRYAKLDQTKKEQIAVAIQELNKPQKKED